MLEKSSNTSDKYKINKRTQLTVKNTRKELDDGSVVYTSIVTLKHNVTGNQPLIFGSVDEIADFIKEMDLEDPQMSLLPQ